MVITILFRWTLDPRNEKITCILELGYGGKPLAGGLGDGKKQTFTYIILPRFIPEIGTTIRWCNRDEE